MRHSVSGFLQVRVRRFSFIAMNNIQINGQRRWGPPENWSGPPPAHGTEIFIKNLPEEVFELELYATFSTAGAVYEVRLPVNWSGLNRGYAFVRFTTVRAADEAIEIFDCYEIRRNRKIRVARSVDNTRLFLTAVPIEKNADQLKRDLSNYVEKVKKVYVYPTVENSSVFRGYAFVEFETHRDAAIAKRVLTPDVCYTLFEKKCVAAWANPLPFLDRSLLKSLNVLFMRNIPNYIKSFHLKKAIENLTGDEEIIRVKKMNNFAFLTFKDHKSAERALHQLQNVTRSFESEPLLTSVPFDGHRSVTEVPTIPPFNTTVSIPFLISDHETQVEWAIPRTMVASSLLTNGKERETRGTILKGSEAPKMSDRGRSPFGEEPEFTNRLGDLTPSQSDLYGKRFPNPSDSMLFTHIDVMPHFCNPDNARKTDSESTAYAFPQGEQQETGNQIRFLQAPGGLLPSSIVFTADRNESRKILRHFSDPANPNARSVSNNIFQRTPAKETNFLAFSDAPFSDGTSRPDFAFTIRAANGKNRNFWRTTCGEESDSSSEDIFFGPVHSEAPPYSPLSPPRSAESSASSPLLNGEHDIFSPSSLEELSFTKSKRNAAFTRSHYFGKERSHHEQTTLFEKLSTSDGRRLENSSPFASYPTLNVSPLKISDMGIVNNSQ